MARWQTGPIARQRLTFRLMASSMGVCDGAEAMLLLRGCCKAMRNVRRNMRVEMVYIEPRMLQWSVLGVGFTFTCLRAPGARALPHLRFRLSRSCM